MFEFGVLTFQLLNPVFQTLDKKIGGTSVKMG
jgi:hypothetical protein